MEIIDFESLDKLRAALRLELDSLTPGVQLTTQQMVDWVLEKSGAVPKTRFLSKLLYDAIRNRPLETFAGYASPGAPRPSKSRYSKGKMVTPVIWHRATSIPCVHCHGTGVTSLDKAAPDPISVPIDATLPEENQ